MVNWGHQLVGPKGLAARIIGYSSGYNTMKLRKYNLKLYHTNTLKGIGKRLSDLAKSGAFIVDPLNHYLGRRGEIFLTACCLTATPIGSAFAKSWQGLFAARFVMGIGIGAKNATVPIYSAEMAPARIRGALVMFWQLWVVAGELRS